MRWLKKKKKKITLPSGKETMQDNSIIFTNPSARAGYDMKIQSQFLSGV